MKRLLLTRGQWALVDDEDFERFGKLKWHARWNPKSQTFYACRWWRFAKGTKERNWRDGATVLLLHREILGLGRQGDKRQVDHINHNGLDNRKENLRICSDTNNKQHRMKRMTNASSIYKGVCFRCDGRRRPWIARINLNRRRINIGSYLTEIEAAQAYDEKAIELFGDYKHLNFPMHSV